MQRKTLRAGHAYLKIDVSIPRVFCHLAQAHLAPTDLHFGRPLGIKMYPDVRGVIGFSGSSEPRGIKVLAHTGKCARQVRRAAGTCEPALAVMMPGAGQWVLIEKTYAVQGDAAQESIVERALQNIRIFAFAR